MPDVDIHFDRQEIVIKQHFDGNTLTNEIQQISGIIYNAIFLFAQNCLCFTLPSSIEAKQKQIACLRKPVILMENS